MYVYTCSWQSLVDGDLSVWLATTVMVIGNSKLKITKVTAMESFL